MKNYLLKKSGLFKAKPSSLFGKKKKNFRCPCDKHNADWRNIPLDPPGSDPPSLRLEWFCRKRN